MNILIIARWAVDAVSAAFALAGFMNFSGVTLLRAVHRLWDYPDNFYRVVGLAQLMVALFLIIPETRIWGIAASGMIIFMTTVTLLQHRQYLMSLAGMMLLITLIPASMAHS